MTHLMPIELAMSANTFVACMLVAAVLLAGWVQLRFEGMGPRSVIGAICGWAASGALFFVIPPLVAAVVNSALPAARIVIIFGVALPIFTYFFLAGGWFMRSVMEQFGGAR